jgi:hypothetical protein
MKVSFRSHLSSLRRPGKRSDAVLAPLLTRPGFPNVAAAEVEAEGLDVSLHGGSAYPHDKTGGAGKLDPGMMGGPMVSADMIDRKIAEAMEKMRMELKSSNGVPPV